MTDTKSMQCSAFTDGLPFRYSFPPTRLEIATNTVAFATEFFPFVTKISGEVANL